MIETYFFISQNLQTHIPHEPFLRSLVGMAYHQNDSINSDGDTWNLNIMEGRQR